jgi:adenylyltransferase/sulfurtransferase
VPQIGPEGQLRLLGSTVLVVGLGALGCVAADLLARAGVGHLRLLDRDVVELTNLQRQTLYAMPDLGESKAVAAARRLEAVNPSIRLTPLPIDLSSNNILQELESPHLIIDATDNAHTRYLLNDAAIAFGLPWVYGGAIAARGIVAAFYPHNGSACLRCLFPTPPDPGELPTCDTAGVLNTATATIGALQAHLAIQLLTNPQTLPDRLISIDFTTLRFSTVHFDRAGCPTCRENRFDFLKAPVAEVASLCGRNTVQILPPGSARIHSTRISLETIAHRWQALGSVEVSKYWVRLRPAGPEQDTIKLGTLFADGRLLLEFASHPDLTTAKGIYTRWVGL